MSGRVVDPNSVQAQFSSLNRDRDGLRRATVVADRERRREEDLLRGLRASQAMLAEKIETANATLGLETKKRQLLGEEEDRLKRVMEEEKRAIMTLTSEIENLDGEERRRKGRFVKEMDSLNDELDAALRRYEERRLMRLITVDSVERVVSAKFDELANSEGAFPEEIPAKFAESLELLREASTRLSQETDKKRSLEEDIQKMRLKMMQQQQLGEMELDDLEKMWEQAWESEDPAGESNPCDSDEINHDHENATDLIGQQQQQQTMDMSLFYGNMKDQGAEENMGGHNEMATTSDMEHCENMIMQ